MSWRFWSLWALNPELDYVPHILRNTGKSPFELTWPNSLRITVKLPSLTGSCPCLTGGTDDVDDWTNGTGTSSTLIPEYPCGSFGKMTRGTLRTTKRLRNLQMVAKSSESCGMAVNMSKSKQNSHTLAKLTWSCLMTSNVMIWVV